MEWHIHYQTLASIVLKFKVFEVITTFFITKQHFFKVSKNWACDNYNNCGNDRAKRDTSTSD